MSGASGHPLHPTSTHHPSPAFSIVLPDSILLTASPEDPSAGHAEPRAALNQISVEWLSNAEHPESSAASQGCCLRRAFFAHL